MTNKEWLDLFFCESFEKQINDLVLDDWDYEVPRDSMINYANHLLAIPYKEYIDYTDPYTYVDDYDLPKIPIDKSEVTVILNYFQQEDNRGLTPLEVGHYINQACHKSYSNVNVYGAKILSTAQIMGLVYSYFGKWYLNCIAYILDELSEEMSQSLISRMILRNKGIASIIYELQSSSHSFSNFFYRKGYYGISRYVGGVCSILSVCRKEGEKEGIVIRFLREDPIFKTSVRSTPKEMRLYKNIERYLNLFESLDDADLFDRDLNVILSMNGFVKAVLKDLIEIEADKLHLRNQCPSPILREGEKLTQQLIVSSDAISVSYVSYDSSWRNDEYLSQYNPALNKDFLRKLLPHQVVASNGKKPDQSYENPALSSKSLPPLPVTDLDAISDVVVKKETPVEYKMTSDENVDLEQSSKELEICEYPRSEGKKEYLRINNKLFEFKGFLDQAQDKSDIPYHQKNKDTKDGPRTNLPFICDSYSCFCKYGYIFVKLEFRGKERILCKSDIHSDLGQLFNTENVIRVSSYESKKGIRIEVHCLTDNIIKVCVFNDEGQKIWDKK